MKLNELMSLDKLEEYILQGYIYKRKHPTLDYWILNYSNSVQFENKWDEVTENCRGLIIDSENNIVGKPFRKFLNYEQVLDKIPKEDFVILEKADGSLGIVVNHNGNLLVSTRGSFESEQANWARNLIQTKYKDFKFEIGITYLFEIIYKNNQIVINYDFEDIVLIGCIENESGDDWFIEEYDNIHGPFRKVKKYDFKNLDEIKKLNWDNSEGFVATFENGFKCKIKFENYLRLHKILTGVSEKNIWEFLMNGQSLDKYLIDTPDEFYRFIQETKEKLLKDYKIVEVCAKMLYEDCKEQTNNQKDFAMIVNKCPNGVLRTCVFSMYHGKDYSKIIWKSIKPKSEKVFKIENE